MIVVELGNYIIPAYAGMILAEQGHTVTKFIKGDSDPILRLRKGQQLWSWLNDGKTLVDRPVSASLAMLMIADVVIDNFRPSTLCKWNIDPVELAERYGIRWISVRSEVGERSFDVVAQARSWSEYADWVPFYVGDTSVGLWAAFKACAVQQPGHYILGQASCMQKLVEGELIIDRPVDGWDTEQYEMKDGEAIVEYRGEVVREPIRTKTWKLDNLYHESGRITV